MTVTVTVRVRVRELILRLVLFLFYLSYAIASHLFINQSVNVCTSACPVVLPVTPSLDWNGHSHSGTSTRIYLLFPFFSSIKSKEGEGEKEKKRKNRPTESAFSLTDSLVILSSIPPNHSSFKMLVEFLLIRHKIYMNAER